MAWRLAHVARRGQAEHASPRPRPRPCRGRAGRRRLGGLPGTRQPACPVHGACQAAWPGGLPATWGQRGGTAPARAGAAACGGPAAAVPRLLRVGGRPAVGWTVRARPVPGACRTGLRLRPYAVVATATTAYGTACCTAGRGPQRCPQAALRGHPAPRCHHPGDSAARGSALRGLACGVPGGAAAAPVVPRQPGSAARAGGPGCRPAGGGTTGAEPWAGLPG